MNCGRKSDHNNIGLIHTISSGWLLSNPSGRVDLHIDLLSCYLGILYGRHRSSEAIPHYSLVQDSKWSPTVGLSHMLHKHLLELTERLVTYIENISKQPIPPSYMPFCELKNTRRGMSGEYARLESCLCKGAISASNLEHSQLTSCIYTKAILNSSPFHH